MNEDVLFIEHHWIFQCHFVSFQGCTSKKWHLSNRAQVCQNTVVVESVADRTTVLGVFVSTKNPAPMTRPTVECGSSSDMVVD